MILTRNDCIYEGDRLLIHADLNHFFAAVALREQPWLRGLPLVVGGNEENRSGIVLTKTPEAKRFGIQTGMSLWQARQACPNIIVIPITNELYDLISWASEDFFRIAFQYTDLVEPFGPDGTWMDVTGSAHLFGGIYNLVLELQRRMKEEEGLTISIGVARNKTLSKFASEIKKPNGIRFIVRTGPEDESWKDMVYPCPVDDMIYIGRARKRDLNRIGVYTLAQMSELSEKQLVDMWGVEGHTLYSYVQGTENEPVYAGGIEPPDKTVSTGSTTPRDLTTWEEYWVQTCVMAERVGQRLRALRKLAKTIEVGVTFIDTDGEMRYRSFQCQLPHLTCLSMDIARCAYALLQKKFISRPIRKITVRVLNLSPMTDPRQCVLAMSAEVQAQKEILEYTIDGINERWPLSVRRFVTMKDDELTLLGVKRAQEFAPPGMRAV